MEGGGHAENNADIATSLALLFLSKGRWPVLMAKVQYRSPPAQPLGKDIDWNRHRNDVNNLTIYVESRWQLELTWQMIDLSKASVDDLLQVPVLFFSGGGDPLPRERGRTRETGRQPPRLPRPRRFHFCRRRRLLQRFRRGLPPAHGAGLPEARISLQAAGRFASDLEGRGEGPARPGPVAAGHRLRLPHERGLCPRDPPGDRSRRWHACGSCRAAGSGTSYSPAVQEKIQGGLAIGINVLAYATNRELQKKYDPREAR